MCVCVCVFMGGKGVGGWQSREEQRIMMQAPCGVAARFRSDRCNGQPARPTGLLSSPDS